MYYRKIIGFVIGLNILTLLSTNGQELDIFTKDRVQKFRIRTVTLFEYDYVNGKPEAKGVKAEIDSFDTQGQKVLQINYREDGSIMSISTFKYDSKGNKIEILKQSADDKDKSKLILNYSLSVRYDSKGNKLLETGFNGVEDFKNVYNYNREGKLAEVNFFIRKRLDEKRVVVSTDDQSTNMKILDGFGSQKYMLRYSYNKDGKVIEETRIENDNTISQRITYTYDKNGILTGETKYINEKLLHKISYVYSPKGQLIEIYKETPESGRFLISKYVYDENDQIKEFQWREELGKDFSRSIFTYDSNGLCKTVDSYYGRFKRQVLSVYVYTFY
ncbi:MAG: hypothetical protein N2662_00970 [Bacteroidales bacterium]|nr:hypothetical protein [Bacteroidales bacterium]